MAPRFRKKLLQLEEMRDTVRVLELLNAMSELLTTMTHGGVSVDNVRKAVLTMKVQAPDPWVPLTLDSAGGFSPFPSWSTTPAYAYFTEAGRTRVRLRGLLNRGSAPSFGTVIASGLPTPSWQSRHATDGDGAHAYVETQVNGTLTFGAGSVTALSLEGITYETALPVPLWDTPARNEATLRGEDGTDYGEPFAVYCLRAVRKDRVPVHTEDTPVWEAPLVGERRTRERRLRIRRLDGLAAGVEHDVTFLCLYF